MIFTVDKKRKKEIQIKNRKNKKGILGLWLFEKILLILIIALLCIFPLYCLSTNSFVSINMRTGQKSYFLVCMLTSLIAGMGLSFVLLVSVLRKRIENSAIGGRIDETIEITDDYLFYTFRVKYQSPKDCYNLVMIDIKNVKKIDYNEALSEISINAMMSEQTVKVSESEKDLSFAGMEQSTVKIYDYFAPSLYEQMKNKYLEE